MKRPTLKEQEYACALWNVKHPIGTVVAVRMDNGIKIQTRTRTKAQMLSGHTAVIWLDGISGCYALERVTATPDNGEKPNVSNQQTMVDFLIFMEKTAPETLSAWMRAFSEQKDKENAE